MNSPSITRRARTAQRREKPVRRRLSPPALEWAEDATGLCPRVTAIGSRSLLVENYTALTSFTPTRVVLGSRSGALCVTGVGLSLSCVSIGALIVHGDIRRVDLPCEGGDAPDEG